MYSYFNVWLFKVISQVCRRYPLHILWTTSDPHLWLQHKKVKHENRGVPFHRRLEITPSIRERLTLAELLFFGTLHREQKRSRKSACGAARVRLLTFYTVSRWCNAAPRSHAFLAAFPPVGTREEREGAEEEDHTFRECFALRVMPSGVETPGINIPQSDAGSGFVAVRPVQGPRWGPSIGDKRPERHSHTFLPMACNHTHTALHNLDDSSLIYSLTLNQWKHVFFKQSTKWHHPDQTGGRHRDDQMFPSSHVRQTFVRNTITKLQFGIVLHERHSIQNKRLALWRTLHVELLSATRKP